MAKTCSVLENRLKIFLFFLHSFSSKLQLHLLNYYYYTIFFEKKPITAGFRHFLHKKSWKISSPTSFYNQILCATYFSSAQHRVQSPILHLLNNQDTVFAASVEISPVTPKTFFFWIHITTKPKEIPEMTSSRKSLHFHRYLL